MVLVLSPANMASIFFITKPSGMAVAFLATIELLMNLPILLSIRGFSKLLAMPHLVPWSIVVFILMLMRPTGRDTYNRDLVALLIVDVISLLFDYPDAWRWFQGEREGPGHPRRYINRLCGARRWGSGQIVRGNFGRNRSAIRSQWRVRLPRWVDWFGARVRARAPGAGSCNSDPASC